MSTQVQLRRGTAAQHATFVGAPGEITVVTDDNTLRVHDGVTPGGHEVSDADLRQAFDAHLAKTVTDPNGVHGFQVEHGIFTPFLYGSTNAGTNTYTSQVGHYTRNGDIVHLVGRILLSAKDANMAGGVRIGGLPIIINNQSNYYPSVTFGRIANVDYPNGYTEFRGYGVIGQNYIVMDFSGDNVIQQVVNSANITGQTEIFFTITYRKN